jgi:neuroglobin
MGCKLGKMVASERQRGANANQDLGGGPPPAMDPRLPLTAKQKYSMLASWKGIARAMDKTGICMFIK